MYVFTLLFLFKSNKFDSLKLELYVCMPLSNHWFYCKMNTKWQTIYLSSDQVTWFKLTTKQLQFTPHFFLNYWRFSCDISPHVHVLVCLHFERWCTACPAHFHVSWLSDFIFYQKPLYKSLHQSFFYSFKTILPSESGVTLYYSTILP
jgi:hypothetical protein